MTLPLLLRPEPDHVEVATIMAGESPLTKRAAKKRAFMIPRYMIISRSFQATRPAAGGS